VVAIKKKLAVVSTKIKLDFLWTVVHGILKGGETTQPLYQSA